MKVSTIYHVRSPIWGSMFNNRTVWYQRPNLPAFKIVEVSGVKFPVDFILTHRETRAHAVWIPEPPLINEPEALKKYCSYCFVLIEKIIKPKDDEEVYLGINSEKDIDLFFSPAASAKDTAYHSLLYRETPRQELAGIVMSEIDTGTLSDFSD